ncbi:MAG: LysR family transcriptional regulator [Roseibium sp.]|uniref:LysR family transcriptional regulator n=1 Tax=Roseibium sp. TaxID=1936156 RepID=UPI002608CD23|nr:LysR family transcriptional regulator [Roseibium sp.]MCV0425001.1 LysR family transcriptional regulator [Roseibium sp.]
METRFLESLLAVVETGSISGAARLQGLTAAAVSQRIRVLENDLNCTLLNRSAHAAVPTDICMRLLPAARNLVKDARQLGAQIDPEGLRGPYRLGAVSTALLDFVPDLIDTFRSQAPDVAISIKPGTSLGLYEGLLSGNLDAAITAMPPFELPKGVACRVLEEQPVVHVSPGGRSGKNGARDKDLPWIIYDRLSWGGRMIWDAHRSLISHDDVICELDALETIAFMVAQGGGQALVPMWRGLKNRRFGLNIKELSGSNTRKMVFLQLSNSPTSAVSALTFEALRKGC